MDQADLLNEYIDNLGKEAKDKVTGYRGILTSISFDLFGCVQYSITPFADEKDKEIKFGHWFDISRVHIFKKKKVMETPNYFKGYVEKDSKHITRGKKGCADGSIGSCRATTFLGLFIDKAGFKFSGPFR